MGLGAAIIGAAAKFISEAAPLRRTIVLGRPARVTVQAYPAVACEFVRLNEGVASDSIVFEAAVLATTRATLDTTMRFDRWGRKPYAAPHGVIALIGSRIARVHGRMRPGEAFRWPLVLVPGQQPPPDSVLSCEAQGRDVGVARSVIAAGPRVWAELHSMIVALLGVGAIVVGMILKRGDRDA